MATPLKWNEEATQSFENPKTTLTTKKYPNFEIEFTVKTDACGIGIGVILLKKITQFSFSVVKSVLIEASETEITEQSMFVDIDQLGEKDSVGIHQPSKEVVTLDNRFDYDNTPTTGLKPSRSVRHAKTHKVIQAHKVDSDKVNHKRST